MADHVPVNVLQTPQTEMKMYPILAPKYRVLKIPLNNLSSSSTTINPSTNTLLEFRLPAQQYNLYRTWIGYNIDIAPTAANCRDLCY